MKKMILTLFLIMISTFSTDLLALKKITRASKFEKIWLENDMLIVHFYKKGDKKKDSKVYEQYKRMEYLFKDASRGYSDLVLFVRIPIRKKKELQELASSYGIRSNNGFVLFSNREKIAQLDVVYPDKATVVTLPNFIDQYLKSQIENKIKKQKEEEEYRRKRAESISFDFNYGPWYGYSWYDRPYWWRYHYAWPYYGSSYYWRPLFGDHSGHRRHVRHGRRHGFGRRSGSSRRIGGRGRRGGGSSMRGGARRSRAGGGRRGGGRGRRR